MVAHLRTVSSHDVLPRSTRFRHPRLLSSFSARPRGREPGPPPSARCPPPVEASPASPDFVGPSLWAFVIYRFSAWRQSLVIVRPETVISWHRQAFRVYWRRKSQAGRPCARAEVRRLIREMASDNPTWGAPRIHGELLKLGFDVSERTVSRYVERIRPNPDGPVLRLGARSYGTRRRESSRSTCLPCRRLGLRSSTSSLFWPSNAGALFSRT